MPSLIGQRYAAAEAALKPLVTTPVEVRAAYSDVKLAADRSQWTVCFQTPAAGSALPPTTAVELSVTAPGTPCPAQAGAALHPSKAPGRTPAPKSTPTPAPGGNGGTTTGGTTGGGGSVTYKSCAEAKAAGAAPIRRGQPGYSKNLDRDNDGIACDK
ncbi:excalibur calcium-binding domain-containing protein [Streptomyces sp. NPDC048340]|uniref:excalibur calcium-binding domain-containing protein n=1 Tax=Streptomyces sp. NPDC048340 TaxID=3365537 RepID=UPI0037142DD8